MENELAGSQACLESSAVLQGTGDRDLRFPQRVTERHPRVLRGMSELKSTPTWTLELSNNDLRLVLAALGGRLKPEHIEEARLLGDRLTQARIKNLQQHIDQLQKSLNGE